MVDSLALSPSVLLSWPSNKGISEPQISSILPRPWGPGRGSPTPSHNTRAHFPGEEAWPRVHASLAGLWQRFRVWVPTSYLMSPGMLGKYVFLVPCPELLSQNLCHCFQGNGLYSLPSRRT